MRGRTPRWRVCVFSWRVCVCTCTQHATAPNPPAIRSPALRSGHPPLARRLSLARPPAAHRCLPMVPSAVARRSQWPASARSPSATGRQPPPAHHASACRRDQRRPHCGLGWRACACACASARTRPSRCACVLDACVLQHSSFEFGSRFGASVVGGGGMGQRRWLRGDCMLTKPCLIRVLERRPCNLLESRLRFATIGQLRPKSPKVCRIRVAFGQKLGRHWPNSGEHSGQLCPNLGRFRPVWGRIRPVSSEIDRHRPNLT